MNVLIGTALALVLLPMGADSLNGRSILSPCPGGQTDSEALFPTTFSDSVTCRWFQYQESCAEAHLKDTLDNMPWIENESTDIAADSAAIILNCPQACEDCPSWLSPNECTDIEDISFPTRLINVNSIHSETYIGCPWVRLFLESCAEDYLKDNLEALGYGSTDIAADSAAMRFYCPLACGDCSPSPSPNESGDFGQEEEEEEQSGCPSGWLALGSLCYSASVTGETACTSTDCDDVENKCAVQGARLPSKEELQAWIGAGGSRSSTYGVTAKGAGGCGSEHWLSDGTGEYGCHEWTCCDHPNRYHVCVKALKGDNIYGFEDVCVGLKSKKCKKQDTCEYKNKQCVKEKYIDMPVDPMDVCVGLKSKKCKKQDMCEYKNKQCVSIDEPIDVCVGLKSKKCKKQDTCEYKRKQKQCVMI